MKASRNASIQRNAGGDSRQPDDHGGHLVPASQNGTSNEVNISAQNGKVNTRDVRAVERGETQDVRNGAEIQTERIAFCSHDPSRPDDLPNIPKVNQVRWSLLKEAVLDSHPDQALKELAQMVFVDAIDHSDNKAFPTAAMLVFYSQMLHIFRSSNGKIPFTNQLIEKILSVSDAEIEQSVKKHTDLFGIQDLISRNTNITSFGIKMEMRTVLMEIFVKGSNFCTSDSRFSVRDFVRNGHGHKLFIEYSFNERESSASIIRLLLDLAMKEALSRPCVKKGDMTRTNFIFDEYAFLSSGLQYLDALKEIGRSKGCRLYGGFQNYNQLMKMHDGRADLAAEELAGFHILSPP